MQQRTNKPTGNFRPHGATGLYPMQMGTNNQFGHRGNQQQQPRHTGKKPNPFGDKNLKTIDYLDAKPLIRFTNPQGKILPKRINGTTAYQQRQITKAIKHARHLALLPFVAQDLS